MSTPLALPAIGTLLEYGSGGSPETWTLITNDSSITGLGLSVNMVDVTNHSQGNPWRNKVPTLLDSGDISFEMFFIPSDSGHKALLALYTGRGLASGAGTPIPFRQTFPDTAATKWYFQGFISKLNFTEPVDNVVKAMVTITTTGAPTFPA